MKKTSRKITLSMLFVVFWVLSCGKDQIVNPPAYTYRIPEETGDGWPTASLEATNGELNEMSVSQSIIKSTD